MTMQSEHQKMKPVLDLVRKLDIATNPEPAAIFEAGSGGFQVWCTPKDHPKGWEDIVMNSGAFSKPCEYVGSVHWKWEEESIVALEIETSAYALADQKPDQYCNLTAIPRDFHRRTIFNRDADIEWLKEKIAWLFAKANVPLPPFEYRQAPLSELGPYLLAHYLAERKIEAEIVTLSGAVEIAPRLGRADAICDLVSTGSTLVANRLHEVETVLESHAVLIRTPVALPAVKNEWVERLLMRIDGVQQVKESKYIMLHAPRSALKQITALLPGAESPTIIPLEGRPDKVAVHAVCRENVFWETLEELKKVGASSMLVLPVEKMLA